MIVLQKNAKRATYKAVVYISKHKSVCLYDKEFIVFSSQCDNKLLSIEILFIQSTWYMEKLLSRMNKFHSNAVKTIIHILVKSKGNSSTANMPPRSKYE